MARRRKRTYGPSVNLDRAQESLTAAQLCLREDLLNSAVSRAYYAMFQAAQVGVERAGRGRVEWSHPGLQAAFAEIVRRRKLYPAIFLDYLSAGLYVRNQADYGRVGVSRTVARRLIRRAAALVSAVAGAGGE